MSLLQSDLCPVLQKAHSQHEAAWRKQPQAQLTLYTGKVWLTQQKVRSAKICKSNRAKMVWGRKNCMHAILARLCFGIAQFEILLGNRFLRWDSSPAIFRHEWHQGFCAIRSAAIGSNIFKMLELYEAPETPIFRRIQTQLNMSRKNSWLKMATIKYVFVSHSSGQAQRGASSWKGLWDLSNEK